MNKILVVGPAWVGDMVMAQCLFKLLKKRDPHVVIDVLAPAWSLPILERMPEVAKGMVMPIGHGKLALGTRYHLGKNLRHQGYTQAIVLPNSFKSALIPWFAHIPLRTGWNRELRNIILNDARRLDKKRYPLMIERFMALGLNKNENLPDNTKDLLPKLQVSEKSQEAALEKHQLNHHKPILAICPGAEFGPAKRWPAEHYATIAMKKIAEGWQVWIFGSPNDKAVADDIMLFTEQLCVDLTGRTSLAEAIDLLGLASAIVSNDSGLMHIAAALQKPLIAVYGPTSAAFTPPLHDKAKVISINLACQPCFQRQCPLKHQRCMKDLPPQLVLNAIEEVIA